MFAPDAQPLTNRDASAATFHRVLSLTEPRTDLPDLSQHAVLSEPATGTGQVPADSEAPSAGQPGGMITADRVPAYYRDFIEQAEHVQKRLKKVREPEIGGVTTTASGAQRAAEITSAFEQAAHRHRHSGPPPQP
jgi:hypothetical protein